MRAKPKEHGFVVMCVVMCDVVCCVLYIVATKQLHAQSKIEKQNEADPEIQEKRAGLRLAGAASAGAVDLSYNSGRKKPHSSYPGNGASAR